MVDIQKELNHAERSCSDKGVRLTAKRKLVLSGLLKSTMPLSAYELADFCREEFSESLPAMSVYRILSFLEGENLVHKLHLTNKYIACSHISCSHSHEVPQFLICSACGATKEIGISKKLVESLKQNVEEAGFELSSPQLEMHSLCKSCASKAA